MKTIFGFRYGFEGMVARHGHAPVRLGPQLVGEIHQQGGTVLGHVARQPGSRRDGRHAGGARHRRAVRDRRRRHAARRAARSSPRSSGAGCAIAVIGIPKTIDNDIHFIDRSFGFESAFAAAVEAIRSAHVEATGARNGVGLVKLMGRHSGFIACHAALASTDANFVLIPEVPLHLEGERGFLRALERRLAERAHAVIVVAEGAGQDLCVEAGATATRHRRQRQRPPQGHRQRAARPHQRALPRARHRR